jgi:hypothetical protein
MSPTTQVICPICAKNPLTAQASEGDGRMQLFDGIGRKEGSAGSGLLTLSFTGCRHVFVLDAGSLRPFSEETRSESALSSKDTLNSFSIPQDSVDKIIESLARHQNKMDAIKFYKAYSGQDLKSSKEYVEGILKEKGISSSKGCFIATVCYGDYNAPEVIVLRNFRDNVLEKNLFGRLFVRFYYAISPFIAQRLAHSGKLKSFVKDLLLKPIVIVIKRRAQE